MDEESLAKLNYLVDREIELLRKRTLWRQDLRHGEQMIQQLNDRLKFVQEMILKIKRSDDDEELFKAFAKGAS